MGNGRSSGLPRGLKDTTRKVYDSWQSQHSAEKTLNKDITVWSKSLSQASHDAIHKYTGSFYTKSNPILRASDLKGMSVSEVLSNISKNEHSSFVNWVKDMDKGLSSYVNNTAFIGYRGAGYSLLGGAKSFDQLKAMVGTTVHDTGHMSVSVVKGHEFSGKVLYEVKVPAGKGVGAYVGKMSQHKSEAEFLFNRGTIFKIAKVRMQGSKPVVTLEVYGRY